MRKIFVFCMLCVFALSTVSFAAINNSNHDMTAGYVAGATQICYYCHGINDTNNYTARVTDFGEVGILCVGRCHSNASVVQNSAFPARLIPKAPLTTTDGIAFSGPIETVDTVSFVAAGSHGNNTTLITDGTGVAINIGQNNNWPYVDTAVASSGNIQCTSCHAVHDNTYTPFIWAPLGDPTPDVGGPGGYCVYCHIGRGTTDMTVAPDGNHPVDFSVSKALASNRSDNLGTVPRHGRAINFDFSPSIFDVVTSNGMELNGQNLGGTYTTGGHMSDFASFANDGSQSMGCYTCHSAHNINSGHNPILNLPADDVTVGFNPVCVGCHGPSTSWANNTTENTVGMTGYDHPCGANTDELTVGVGDYRTSVGNFTILVNMPGAPIPVGNQGEVMCLSCHDIHYGDNNTMCIAALGQGAGNAVCNACHDGGGLPDVTDISESGVGAGEKANVHHRTTPAPGIGAAIFDTPTDAGDLNISVPSWAGVTTSGGWRNMGVLTDGMGCADCHCFNGTAHNW